MQIKVATPARVADVAAQLGPLASDVAALRARAVFADAAARVDAELLDAVVEDIWDQVMVIVDRDATQEETWAALIAYRKHHHRGGGHHPKGPPPAPAAT